MLSQSLNFSFPAFGNYGMKGSEWTHKCIEVDVDHKMQSDYIIQHSILKLVVLLPSNCLECAMRFYRKNVNQ